MKGRDRFWTTPEPSKIEKVSSGPSQKRYLEKPGKIRELRKTIAQIQTIENEYKLGIRVDKEKKVKKQKQKKTKTGETR